MAAGAPPRPRRARARPSRPVPSTPRACAPDGGATQGLGGSAEPPRGPALHRHAFGEKGLFNGAHRVPVLLAAISSLQVLASSRSSKCRRARWGQMGQEDSKGANAYVLGTCGAGEGWAGGATHVPFRVETVHRASAASRVGLRMCVSLGLRAAARKIKARDSRRGSASTARRSHHTSHCWRSLVPCPHSSSFRRPRTRRRSRNPRRQCCSRRPSPPNPQQSIKRRVPKGPNCLRACLRVTDASMSGGIASQLHRQWRLGRCRAQAPIERSA